MRDLNEGRLIPTNAENVLRVLTELAKNNHASLGVCIRYSTVSGKFYFDAGCEIKEGVTLRPPGCNHQNTIEQAAEAIMQELQGKQLVFNAGDDEKRREVFFCNLTELFG